MISVAHLFRHPIKAHGREAIASVRLLAGAALPWDRHWAVMHDQSRYDPADPGWRPCPNFQRGARTPSVMAIEARFAPETGDMVLTHPDLPLLAFRPQDEGARLIEWLAPISPREGFRPVALVRAPDRAMTDTPYASVSIKNLASNAALGRHMGQDLSIHRWRGNVWLDGLAPWAEFDLVGRHLRLGGAVLEIRERVGRCRATTVDPATGQVDGDTLTALRAVVGEQDFGVFGVVVEGGDLALGDGAEVLA